jgi:hypothetical protein
MVIKGIDLLNVLETMKDAEVAFHGSVLLYDNDKCSVSSLYENAKDQAEKREKLNGN